MGHVTQRKRKFFRHYRFTYLPYRSLEFPSDIFQYLIESHNIFTFAYIFILTYIYFYIFFLVVPTEYINESRLIKLNRHLNYLCWLKRLNCETTTIARTIHYLMRINIRIINWCTPVGRWLLNISLFTQTREMVINCLTGNSSHNLLHT
jgi:hypothetical protein